MKKNEKDSDDFDIEIGTFWHFPITPILKIQ